MIFFFKSHFLAELDSISLERALKNKLFLIVISIKCGVLKTDSSKGYI